MMASLRASRGDGDWTRLLRFLVTGVVNTAFGYGVFALLVLVGLPPQPALALSFVAGVLWNYVIHARFVFGTEGYRKLPSYAAVYVALYLLNSACLAAALRAGVTPLKAQAVLTLIMAMISFVALSFVLTGRLPGQGQGDKSVGGRDE